MARVADQTIWNFFLNLFEGNEYAAAGACGNMKHESGLLTNNAENSWNNATGHSDDWLTERINNCITGTDPFIDLAEFLKKSWWVNPYGFGYGLSQWTTTSRRTELWNRTIARGINIDSEAAQLQYVEDEFTGRASSGNYAGVRTAMINATSVDEAVEIYRVQYEGGAKNSQRNTYAWDFYNTFAGTSSGYPVVITVNGNGKAWASYNEVQIFYADAGLRIELGAVPNDDDYFLLWVADYPSTLEFERPATVADNYFTMPASKVNLTATFTGTTPDPPPYPPEPPTPMLQSVKKKSMPIWMYPMFRI